MTYLNKASNLGDAFRRSCQYWGPKPVLLVYGEGRFSPISYTELFEMVYEVAKSLYGIGLRRGDSLCIYSEKCLEWGLVDWACQLLGVVPVPIYPSLLEDQASFIARNCEAKVAMVGSDVLATRLKDVEGLRCFSLKSGEVGPPALPKYGMESELTLDRLQDITSSIQPGDLATIIYTSGTSGEPKGAMLTHNAILSIIRSIRSTNLIDDRDTFLSWLPMSHVYERVAGHFLPTLIGSTVAYTRSLASLSNDMLTVKPTIILCVPRFLDSLKSRFLDGLAKQKKVQQAIFNMALNTGLHRVRGEFSPLAGLFDALALQKARAKFGGRLRLLISGGAALPVHIGEFFLALGIDLLQGYGLTETCGASVVNRPEKNRPETVGMPFPGVEVKLAEDGEILLRGAGLMTGYFHMPEATAAAIDGEGWFHTGDIGKFDGEFLMITDRKKDLLVLGNGKNVAPQPIEGRLTECPWIAEAVLFGDGMDYCAALIVPDFERIGNHAKGQGWDADTPAKIASSEDVRKLIKTAIDALNKELPDYERIKQFRLLDRAFSIESGELTPSLKVKRRVVKEHYGDLIQGMFR